MQNYGQVFYEGNRAFLCYFQQTSWIVKGNSDQIIISVPWQGIENSAASKIQSSYSHLGIFFHREGFQGNSEMQRIIKIPPSLATLESKPFPPKVQEFLLSLHYYKICDSLQ